MDDPNLKHGICWILNLADELLVYLFTQPNLEALDIINLSKCCRKLCDITKSDEIWKYLLIRRYRKISINIKGNCFEIFKEKHLVIKDVNIFLKWLIKEAFNLDGIPNKIFEKVHALFGTDNKNIKHILEYLQSIWDRDPRNDFACKLNEIYYAERLFIYIYHYSLKVKMTKLLFNNGATNMKSLEKGAIVISKWHNPKKKVSGKLISKQIDDIALTIKSKIPQSILNNMHNLTIGKVEQIISIVNNVLYKEMKFKGNTREYYNVRNSFINEVLINKTGIPITLSIIYISVCRRLGLDIHGVNFPNHFIVRVTVRQLSGNEFLYIDCFDNGIVLNEEDCLQRFMPYYERNDIPRSLLFKVADELKIFIRMLANIGNIYRQNSVLNTRNLDSLQMCTELTMLLSPGNEENRLLLSRIYLHQGINLEEVVKNLQELFHANNNLPSAVLDSLLAHAHERQNEKRISEVKCRSKYKEVEYRIGMVMKHQRYQYQCVIYGWDPVCTMPETWKQQMRVYELSNQDRQPFYNVLAADGSSRYAAQENLLPVSTGVYIDHPDIGKYFESFDGYVYNAYEILNDCYPEDQPIPDDKRPNNPYVDTVKKELNPS